jgi:hypothetical protein
MCVFIIDSQVRYSVILYCDQSNSGPVYTVWNRRYTCISRGENPAHDYPQGVINSKGPGRVMTTEIITSFR